MNDKYKILLDQYDLHIDYLKRGRGEIICGTDQGLFALSATKLSEERLAVEHQWKEELIDQGFTKIDQYIVNKEHEFISYDKYYEPFVMRRTFNGTECNIHSPSDLSSACRNLASFHRASGRIPYHADYCIFRHFAWSGTEGKKRADDGITIQERMRDLSCDIAVEHMIDGMNYRSIRFSRSLLRRETYRLLEKEGKTLNAQRVYKILSEWNLNEKDLTNLEQEFRTDDHRYWESKKPDQKPNPMLSRKWGEINDGIETDLETFSQEAGERDGDFLEQIKTENRSRYDYREFLRKFAVFHEELAVDDDSFDYNFYTYGLRLYGNMPLIEPLESKEVKKIEEFVIVIDTSMSCSGELVRKFLEETYGVLSESESFFTKINVHIIQCDEKVHTDKRITSRKEMKDYMEHLELYGDGGTDFRPAFEWVDKLLEQHEFHNLKGMIYFTDGFGIYPKKMPPYKTAFVFMQDNYRDVYVPVWAMKLILDEDDFEKPDR